MKKFVALLLAFVFVLCLAGCQSKTENNNGSTNNNDSSNTEDTDKGASGGSDNTETELPLQGKKIAYILNVASSDIFQMAVDGAKSTAEALGMTVDVYFTDVDNVKFQDYVNTCANQGYDAMFLSHGNQETAYDLVTMLREKGIEVVCFDTQFVDASGEKVEIDGATQMFQDDQKMADLLLDYICNTVFSDKTAAGEPIKILKIWRGPGISPFDRRQETYLEYEQEGLIETVEVIAPTDPANAENSMREVTASVLAKYSEGDVDAIWGCYDAYTRGAYQALSEAGRTDIPVVSVDISNQDINYMLDDSKVWLACSTVDFTTVGEQGVRILAMKLYGETTEAVYNLTPSLVTYDMLNTDSTVLNLKDSVVGYGVNNDHISDWMKDYISAK